MALIVMFLLTCTGAAVLLAACIVRANDGTVNRKVDITEDIREDLE